MNQDGREWSITGGRRAGAKGGDWRRKREGKRGERGKAVGGEGSGKKTRDRRRNRGE